MRRLLNRGSVVAFLLVAVGMVGIVVTHAWWAVVPLAVGVVAMPVFGVAAAVNGWRLMRDSTTGVVLNQGTVLEGASEAAGAAVTEWHADAERYAQTRGWRYIECERVNLGNVWREEDMLVSRRETKVYPFRWVAGRLQGVFQGVSEGRWFTGGSFIVQAGKNRPPRRAGVVVVECAEYDFPVVQVKPKRSWLGQRAEPTMLCEFDDVFTVKTGNPDTAAGLLTPQIRDYLRSFDVRDLHVGFHGRRIVVATSYTDLSETNEPLLDGNQISQLLRVAHLIIRMLPQSAILPGLPPSRPSRSPNATPPGWYPYPPTNQWRWWDGSAWLDGS